MPEPRPLRPRSSSAAWDNPSKLCGRRCCRCPVLNKIIYEPVGAASEAWSLLGPHLSARARALASTEATFSIHMAMVGDSEQNAAPYVIFCVEDGDLQTALRDDGILNDLLGEYPEIAIGFSPNLPQHLADDVSDDASSVEHHQGGELPSDAVGEGHGIVMSPSSNPPQHLPQDMSSAGLHQDGTQAAPVIPYHVWATDANPRIGIRFYVQPRNGGPCRMSTGGPVFRHGERTYQTTVRHVFFRSEQPQTASAQPSFQFDLDMDDSDAEDDDSPGTRSPDLGSEVSYHSEQDESPGTPFTPFSSYASPSPMEGLEVDYHDLNMGRIPQGAVHIGNAVPETVEGVQRAVDVALVEVNVGDSDPNIICFDPFDSTRRMRVTRPVDFPVDLTEERDWRAPVVVVTPGGPVCGRLLQTVAYIKPRHQREFLEVYPLILEEGMELEAGYCGSVVVLIRNDEALMLGHVVFGHPDTNVAYILPMQGIVRDIARALHLRSNHEISLHHGGGLPIRLQEAWNFRTEFASPQFYRELGEDVMPAAHKLHGLIKAVGKLEKKVTDSARTFLRKMVRTDAVSVANQSFADLFFQLPPEIRDQVICHLNFREAISLRHVSQRFRSEVTVNGSAISKRFLVSNPLPPLARSLYPHDSPDLAHIDMVGRSHAVAWRLADHVVQWLRNDILLYGSRFQQEAFQPRKVRMKQRLLPSLLVLGRYFDLCRDSLEEEAQGKTGYRNAPIAFAFERRMMGALTDELIFQTSDVALVLVGFLRRTMRPPSKYGAVERTLRLGRTRPPSNQEIAAVLYHGGLETMTAILDLEALDKKETAIRAYCTTPQPRKAAWLDEPEDTSEDSPGGLGAGEQRQQLDLRALLPRLPDLDRVWRPCGEAVLRERGAIRGPRDLNTFPVIMRDLLHAGETSADRLYRQGHDLWHALSDREKRGRASPSARPSLLRR